MTTIIAGIGVAGAVGAAAAIVVTLLHDVSFSLPGWSAKEPICCLIIAGLALIPGLIGTAYWRVDKRLPRQTGFLICSWSISASLLLICLLLYLLASSGGGLKT